MRWRSLKFLCRLVPPSNPPPNLNRRLQRNQCPHPGCHLQTLPATPISVAAGMTENNGLSYFLVLFSNFFCHVPSAQNIKCETRLRDKCRGSTCSRSDYFQKDFVSFPRLACTSLWYKVTLVFNSSFLCLCRYNCPANCLNKKGKVWGTLHYDVVRLANEKHLASWSNLYISS